MSAYQAETVEVIGPVSYQLWTYRGSSQKLAVFDGDRFVAALLAIPPSLAPQGWTFQIWRPGWGRSVIRDLDYVRNLPLGNWQLRLPAPERRVFWCRSAIVTLFRRRVRCLT